MTKKQNEFFLQLIRTNFQYHAGKDSDLKEKLLEDLNKAKSNFREVMGEEMYKMFMLHGQVMQQSRKEEIIAQKGEEAYNSFVELNKTLWD